VKTREAVIVSAVRTAVGKAPLGALSRTPPVELAAAAIRGALDRVPALARDRVEDVLLGCAFPEAEQGMNFGRLAALRAGLPVSTAGATINRFCASGLEAIADATLAVEAGRADVVVAGGCESMSLVPMGGGRFSPDPALVADAPDTYMSMGLTAETVAERFDVPRAEQDAWALRSHRNAVAAIDAGRFDAEIVPVRVAETAFEDGRPVRREREFRVDEGPRRDTSVEAITALPPVFRRDGTVTAGNTSQRSDGAAAAVVVAREAAAALGLRPLGRLRAYAVAGVAPDVMGIGPIDAVRKVLRRARVELSDVGLVELNEAFAAQVLAVVRVLELDPRIVNVNGGAIALGHPLGCTGAKLTATLLHEMARRDARLGIVTMCVGGGMGAAGVFERPEG
jgi:acetyl-CoA acyltransferase